MKSLFLIVAAAAAALALSSQTAQKPASPPRLTGFPFQDESLHYTVNWPSGLGLGEVTLSARRTATGWNFDASIDAGVPGFAISDRLDSGTTADLCSTEFERDLNHAGRKSREKITFDAHNMSAHRVTLFPSGGGSTDLSVSACPRDALAFFYFVREEMGQGRVAPPSDAYFGNAYSVQLRYIGESNIPVNGTPTVTDHVVASVQGPKSEVDADLYFARDAARTPLLIKLPLSMGTFSLELVR